MVEVPAPSIVALPASVIFITLLLLLLKVNAPDDGDVGLAIENSASPKVFESVASLPNVGTAGLTV